MSESFDKQDGITLKDYFDARIDSVEKIAELNTLAVSDLSKATTDSIEKSTNLAKEDMERRLEGMNEFRTQLKDQTATFINRGEYDTKHQLLLDSLNNLSKIIYMGLGGVLVLEFLFKFFVK